MENELTALMYSNVCIENDNLSSYQCFACRRVFLHQLEAEAGDLFLDAHHDIGVILIFFKLVGEARHAVPNKPILSSQVCLDYLQHNTNSPSMK